MIRLLHPRPIRGGLFAALAITTAAAWSLTVNAAPQEAAESLPSQTSQTSQVAPTTRPAAQAAAAAAPAQRLRVVPPQGFPMAPSPRCDILDNFGDGRGGGRSHEGIDILATKGQEVYAMVAGTLTTQVIDGSGQAGAGLSGNLWQLTAATGGTYYVYAHLSAFAPGLAKGSTVTKGHLIGFVGDTGNPGPGNYHLHFEIHPGGGSAVDPLPLLRPLPTECKVSG